MTEFIYQGEDPCS